MFVSEQQTATQFNLSYRGLGNPQEFEFVLVLEDGIPISTDWIGFPTVYYMPLPQSLAEVQLIRGGSSLLYGPEPAPAVNLVPRRPAANQPLGAYSENTLGSDGLFSSFNTIEGSSGDFAARANLGHVRNNGQRENGGSRTTQVDVYLAYRPKKDDLWYLDLHAHDASSGDPGKLSFPQYLADPNAAPTSFNHDWVRRTSVTVGNERDLAGGWRSESKLWAAWQRLYSRSAPAGAEPATTVLQDERFRSQGIDWRFRKRWGRGNAVTFGSVLYHDSAPSGSGPAATSRLRATPAPALHASARPGMTGTVRSSRKASSACRAGGTSFPPFAWNMKPSGSTKAYGLQTSFAR